MTEPSNTVDDRLSTRLGRRASVYVLTVYLITTTTIIIIIIIINHLGRLNKSSAVAEMRDRLATIDIGGILRDCALF